MNEENPDFEQENSDNDDMGISARELLLEEQNQTYLLTLCRKIDEMLGGGLRFGEVVEICMSITNLYINI